MIQERRCYDKGAWVVVREHDGVIVHTTTSNQEAHDFADRITDAENIYHYVDERAAGITLDAGE